ncbi:Eco57I restriction-modification methylase domain-containing protein [Metabacillus malikii]|uniref:site-specific DNA-methyltransferase (adenine-specific) n=1 Tax=Metabacillus malikii TaxID=1504265 RepID=A0ABT9ZHK5_9BACI|nr:N-6 DNA methylase [Metabacillus malikii]MDQ0231778.1 gas vesicle protein [Metabacillus malikii]
MAIDLTGITNVNEFYSHHYLDSLLEGDLKGLYKKWAETDDRSPYEKLSGIANKYFKAKTDGFNEKKPEDRIEITRKFHINFLEALGYETKQVIKYSEDGQAIPVITSEKRDGNEYLWVLETVFWSDDISVFEQPLVLENNEDEISWFDDSIDMAIQQVFRLDEPPRWIVLLAGQMVYLIDRNKWGQGKYLLFDLDELFGRKQPETLKATAALLSKDALAPDEGNVLHDELDENSHKHAFSVSEDLKYGIRRAVELIGNEFIHYRSKVAKQKIYGDEELADKLTKESLTYLYRLLFLFYAESRSEELNVVPMKSEEYRLGYSLETLRELEQAPLTTEASREGYFFHESLTTLFKIVNDGFGYDDQFEIDYESGKYVDFGFKIDGLQSPLFNPKETPLLSSVKFRNFVLQEVIQLLSLSKEGSKQRGRISYAQLGINQLGAVYEGLLSYSGFFAQETLYEVKPENVSSTDETGQSYFVPESNIEQYKDEEFVLFKDDDGLQRRKKYERGSFIFRLAGRDREKSASYYTPEVLTKSLVKYSLKDLLKSKTADEVLDLTICEPAMGSGAFLNEAINQLADAYLERKQKELGEVIKPENYAHEKQRVKAYLATNNIYGVDLNSTAVELAKVSIWLNTIYEGAKTPWFTPKFATGNSLIGAKFNVISNEDLLNENYQYIPLNNLNQVKTGFIFQFLIPDIGMVSYENDKNIKQYYKSNIENIKEWRKNFHNDFSKESVKNLNEISIRISEVWKRLLKSRKTLIKKTREHINVYGQYSLESEDRRTSIEQKEKLKEELLIYSTSPYKALKLILDYWCSLWFWPVDNIKHLPTWDEYLLDISAILDAVEGVGVNIDDLKSVVPRLSIVDELSLKYKFIHWEVEFPEVFYQKNGFDLIVGNPPWLKPKWSEKDVLSDFSPICSLRKLSAKEINAVKEEIFRNKNNYDLYFNELIEYLGIVSFGKAKINYPNIGRSSVNLYKLFILKSFELINNSGTVGLLTDSGVYEDPNAELLRTEFYKRLRYLFKFSNQLNLFAEESLAHVATYCINIFGEKKERTNFNFICNLYHPKTIDECFIYDGSYKPLLKTKDQKWELKGHIERIIPVNDDLLELFSEVFEGSNSKNPSVRIPMIHNKSILDVISRFKQEERLGDLSEELMITTMFHETDSQNNGIINRNVTIPENINQMVLSGPHYYVATPFNKQPRENCRSKGDYEVIDLTQFQDKELPRTLYTTTDSTFSQVPKFRGVPSTNYYRYAGRAMAQSTNERTLISALIPPNLVHTNGTVSIAFKDEEKLLVFLGLSHSIVYDGLVKIIGKSNIYGDVLRLLPIPKLQPKLKQLILHRTLRLNCLTQEYSDIWERHFSEAFLEDNFSKKDNRLTNISIAKKHWNNEVPLRNPFERRLALVELDVLAAIAFNIDFEELYTLYETQFPLTNSYEKETYYDQNGKIVFTKNRTLPHVGLDKSEWEKIMEIRQLSDMPKELSNYIPPFTQSNRIVDMENAYNYFLKIL